MIMVDTNIWSLAFRRYKADERLPSAVYRLRNLIQRQAEIVLPGIVLQEVLSGLRESAQFERLHQTLLIFPVILADETDHVKAAQVVNLCQTRGIVSSSVDSLIAAMCLNREAELLTLDQDFQHIARCCPLKLAVQTDG